jgi:hypothetical protein
METERKKKSTKRADYEERKKNATSRYMEDSRKQYLLASNKESLQMLIDSQKEELTRVLIELKSEYDLLTRESYIKKQLIDEYNKKINMIQVANDTNERKQESQKESTNHIKEGIELKKAKKGEELYQKKTLTKQVEKLNRDLFIIQKEIVKCENEAVLLEKKKERARLDENIIKEKGNQVYSKIEQQNEKNLKNKNENDLQVQYYETVIKQKYMFMQFADERKERQKKIEQEAKNDAQDKQEVEKRRKLQLLMLYNQFLRTRMDEQLKRYEDLEDNYEKIRDICGTQDLEFIIDFVMLRNKRYNYAVQVVNEKEQKIKDLKKEIKKLNTKLIKLKNAQIVSEKESDSRTETTVENSGLEQEEIELTKKESERNQELLILGKKYNDIDLAYNKVLENIQNMKEYDQAHPLNIKDEEIIEIDDGEEKPEGEGEQKEEEKKPKEIKLNKEEEDIVQEYEKFLKKVYTAFKRLYLCKSKQEFLQKMSEEGKLQQNDNKSNLNKSLRFKGKRTTKRINKTERLTTKTEGNENKKNDEAEEEEDISNYDPDKSILKTFLKEQKKEVDEFINVKKQAPKPAAGTTNK